MGDGRTGPLAGRNKAMIPLSVKLAAIGLLAIGLLIGFVAGLITGWCARERR